MVLRQPFNSSLTPDKDDLEQRCNYDREMKAGNLIQVTLSSVQKSLRELRIEPISDPYSDGLMLRSQLEEEVLSVASPKSLRNTLREEEEEP